MHVETSPWKSESSDRDSQVVGIDLVNIQPERYVSSIITALGKRSLKLLTVSRQTSDFGFRGISKVPGSWVKIRGT